MSAEHRAYLDTSALAKWYLNLIDRYPDHPLRTLDALHLAVALHAGIEIRATADTVMADAATAMGFAVARF